MRSYAGQTCRNQSVLSIIGVIPGVVLRQVEIVVVLERLSSNDRVLVKIVLGIVRRYRAIAVSHSHPVPVKVTAIIANRARCALRIRVLATYARGGILGANKLVAIGIVAVEIPDISSACISVAEITARVVLVVHCLQN